MVTNLAASITKAASTQSYYTIHLLADRERVDDAYRAYAYFRWVDDLLDSGACLDSALSEAEITNRRAFLERQQSLFESCYHGQSLPDVNIQERMLVELIQHDPEKNSGLHDYLHNMMLVMDFDARRRGRLISQAELNQYTRWLAIAVTEALHYFIGHDDFSPRDERRYLAVSAAHIAHMLRDTYDDIQAGYINIPLEVLEANRIGQEDILSDAYRAWVKNRVQLARQYFHAGRDYFWQVQNPRCRLACFAYIARFAWLLDTIEKEGFCLRPAYNERKSPRVALKVSWLTLSPMLHLPAERIISRPHPSNRLGKP